MSDNRQHSWSARVRSRTRADWAVASFAMLAIAVHDAVHVHAGRYWDVFWVCNVAAVVVGPAILLRSPLLACAALTWLLPGTVVWLADAAIAGSNILPTSYAVHFGGTAAAFYATWRAGYSRRGWLAALALLAFCIVVSRIFLPAAANVNAAHAIPRGWSSVAQSRSAFVLSATVLAAAACALGSAVSRAVAKL